MQKFLSTQDYLNELLTEALKKAALCDCSYSKPALLRRLKLALKETLS